MDDRANLAAQLVRCHALLWTVEDARVKDAVRQRIRALETRIAALDGGLPNSSAARPRPAKLAR